MNTWLNKFRGNRHFESPKPAPTEPESNKLNIYDFINTTYTTNSGKTTVWNFKNRPNSLSFDALSEGDIVTWVGMDGAYYKILKNPEGKLYLEKMEDQTPPK